MTVSANVSLHIFSANHVISPRGRGREAVLFDKGRIKLKSVVIITFI